MKLRTLDFQWVRHTEKGRKLKFHSFIYILIKKRLSTFKSYAVELPFTSLHLMLKKGGLYVLFDLYLYASLVLGSSVKVA